MSFKPLKNLLDENTELKKTTQTGHSPLMALIRHWEKIIGEKLAKNTKPLKIKNDTLIILTSHSNFSHHLKMMEREIIKKVILHLPQLKGKIRHTYYYVNESFFQENKGSEPNASEVRKVEKKSKKLHPYSPEYIELKKQATDLFDEKNEFLPDLISLYIQLKSEDK